MDKHQQQYINALLQRYLKGACSPEEEAIIQKWYDDLELSREDILTDDHPFRVKAENYLRDHLRGLPRPESVPAKMKGPAVVRKIHIQWAAAAVLAAAVALAIFYLVPSGRSRQSIRLIAMETGGKQQKKIVLPDSSVVWLNRNSRLEWAENFDDSIRMVKLSGEALFDIKQNAVKPFVVQAGNTSTRVLGTVFNIEAYKDEQEIKVALLNGKVQFMGQDKPGTVLSPGRMVTWLKKDKDYRVTAIAAEVAAWTNGFIVFNEVPLTEAIARLAVQNAWRVVWQTKDLPLQPISAVFTNETPVQILQGLAFTHHLKFKIEKEVVTIF